MRRWALVAGLTACGGSDTTEEAAESVRFGSIRSECPVTEESPVSGDAALTLPDGITYPGDAVFSLAVCGETGACTDGGRMIPSSTDGSTWTVPCRLNEVVTLTWIAPQ